LQAAQEDSPFVALAGASENRFDALMNLLASLNHHEPLMKTIVIDFGLAHASIRELEHWCRYCKVASSYPLLCVAGLVEGGGGVCGD